MLVRAILEDFDLQDAGLKRMAAIVQAADVPGQEFVAKEGAGLACDCRRFPITCATDEERLRRQFPVYDALYEFSRKRKD